MEAVHYVLQQFASWQSSHRRLTQHTATLVLMSSTGSRRKGSVICAGRKNSCGWFSVNLHSMLKSPRDVVASIYLPFPTELLRTLTGALS